MKILLYKILLSILFFIPVASVFAKDSSKIKEVPDKFIRMTMNPKRPKIPDALNTSIIRFVPKDDKLAATGVYVDLIGAIHIGDQKYFKSKFSFGETNSLYSFETKRNLITNSAEFYNLSYEYINDCLRAGLVYRREFCKDSEIEPENSLMFKITLTPFGNINSPSFSQ